MIGKFEISQAARGHIERMEALPELWSELGIDVETLDALMESLLEARDPDSLNDRRDLFKSAMLEGFILGVRAKCSEDVVLCQSCGKPSPRVPDNDPVPEDFNPCEHAMICHECLLSSHASMN